METTPADSSAGSAPSPRVRRALAIGAAAVIGIALTGLVYVRSGEHPATALPKTLHVSVQRPGDVYTYTFLSPTTGWAAEAAVSPPIASGPFWIWRTTDGAKHWRMVLSGHSGLVFETVGSAQFIDATNAFVLAGDPLKLYRTSDGGGRWTNVDLPTAEAVQLVFSDVRHGWLDTRSRSNPPAYSGSHLYATSDGGDSWAQLPDPPTDAESITARAPSEIWAGGGSFGHAYVYLSADSGLSWTRFDLPTPPTYYVAGNDFGAYVELLPNVGVAATVGSNNGIYRAISFDLGHSWKIAASPIKTGPGDTSYGYQDSLHWWAVAGSLLYKSTDAGQSWTRIADTMPPGLRLLRLLDSRHAWAQFVYATGTGLTYSSDGGVHWTPTTPPRAPAG